MGFENLGLNKKLLKAVKALGFDEPTPIQLQAIPEIISGHQDLVGLAQTGTGKTAAFGLPMLQLIDIQSIYTQGVVICPTRELCRQISADFEEYSRYLKGTHIVSVYGGASIVTQIRQIKKGAQIIVATPGRLIDLINRKIVDITRVSYVVLDEADEMLNMGFAEDIDKILRKTPPEKTIWLFSATMPKAVAKIAKKYMHAQLEITVGRRNSVASNIEHSNYIIKETDRYQALKRIIDFYPDIFGLIFCRTRNETRQVAEKLIKDGYNAEALHGELSQGQRDYVMQRFREKSLQLLVATDVAARGLDVDDISHVINYNLPDEPDIYTHRSGRTARAGKSGIAIVLMNTREKRKLALVEQKAGITFNYAKVPSGHSVCEKQLFEMVERMVAVDINHAEIEKFLPAVYRSLAGLSKEELIQKFVSTEFNRFLSYYKNANDINAKITKNRNNKPASEKKRHPNRKTKRFFINVGRLDNIREGAITRLICDNAGIRSNQIGKIELLREFSFFEIETDVAQKVLKSLKRAKLDGMEIRAEYYVEKKKINSKPKSKKSLLTAKRSAKK